MEKIKTRINKLKEDIDACEQKECESNALLKEANARLEAAETEKSSFRRRIKIIQDELAKTKERLAEKTERLDSLEMKTAEHETAVKNLENQEVEGDERMGTLSDQLKRGQIEVETYDTQWREAKRKEKVLLNDLEKAGCRYEEGCMRCDQFLKAINNATEQIKDLEAREYDQSERENLRAEKMTFLADQQKEALTRAEAAERDTARLKRILTGLDLDIKNWHNKTADVRAEIEEVNNMADDMD